MWEKLIIFLRVLSNYSSLRSDLTNYITWRFSFVFISPNIKVMGTWHFPWHTFAFILSFFIVLQRNWNELNAWWNSTTLRLLMVKLKLDYFSWLLQKKNKLMRLLKNNDIDFKYFSIPLDTFLYCSRLFKIFLKRKLALQGLFNKNLI